MTIANPQHCSLEGAKFIACREALVTVAYPDGQKDRHGNVPHSIGFGSQTPKVEPGDTITLEGAFKRLVEDIRKREPMVNRALTRDVSQPAFDALLSLFYQRGSSALFDVAARYNSGVPEPVAALRFAEWASGQDGKLTAGHSKRRVREMIMAVDGYYGDISQVLVFDGDPRIVKPHYMPFPDLDV